MNERESLQITNFTTKTTSEKKTNVFFIVAIICASIVTYFLFGAFQGNTAHNKPQVVSQEQSTPLIDKDIVMAKPVVNPSTELPQAQKDEIYNTYANIGNQFVQSLKQSQKEFGLQQ